MGERELLPQQIQQSEQPSNNRNRTLFTYDMVKIQSGEILTLYGSYDGPTCRTRLSFYPSEDGDRVIDDIPYKKATYEVGYEIQELPKILDLPGEQHYLLDRTKAVEVYRASDTFGKLSTEDTGFCETFIDKMYDNCGIERDAHGLTGSLALNNKMPSSDFDWITYNELLRSKLRSIKPNPISIDLCVE